MAKRIFTFWEPENSIPEYLKLCMQTWTKFLPDYEIVILNYSNLEYRLGKDYFDTSLFENFSLPKQADAIRSAILNKYGGIWFDTDTIVTSEKIQNIINLDSDFILLNRHIGVIIAKPGAKILRKWEKDVHKKIQHYKVFKKVHTFLNLQWVEDCFERWDYLGNAILKRPLKTKNKKKFYKLDKLKVKAFPEDNYAIENNRISGSENYKYFYFENDFSEYTLKDNGGLIQLHNSWTPEEFKSMSKEEFLTQDITLAKILKTLTS